MNKPISLIIRGPSGIGKTTLAKKLTEEFDTPTEYLNCDKLRRALFGEEKWQKEYKVKIVKEIAKRAREILGQGHNIIIDDIFEYPEQIEILRRELPGSQWITLEGNIETLLKRDKMREIGRDDRGYCGEEGIKYLYEHYFKDTIEGEIKTDTEGKTPDEVYQEIKRRLML